MIGDITNKHEKYNFNGIELALYCIDQSLHHCHRCSLAMALPETVSWRDCDES